MSSVGSVLADREARLQEVNERITSTKSDVRDLVREISDLRLDILHFQNANSLYESINATALPSRQASSSEVVELDDEHNDILRERRDGLALMSSEVEKTQRLWEIERDRLNLLWQDCADVQERMSDLSDSLCVSATERNAFQARLAFVELQIKERNNELSMMRDLKREAETALQNFLKKSEGDEAVDMVLITSEHAILQLQNQLRIAHEQLTDVDARLADAKHHGEYEREEDEKRKLEYEVGVPWAQEKDELKSELDSLRKQLMERKTGLKTSETKMVSGQDSWMKIRPLMKRWKGAECQVSDGETVQTLLSKLDKAVKERDEKVRKERENLAAIVTENTRLEREVEKSKEALDRAVSKFRADDNAMQREIDRLRVLADTEEAELLRQIDAAKIRIAQKRLRKGKR